MKTKLLSFTLLQLAFLFFTVLEVGAQINVGPSATVTASHCGTGTCSDFNDLDLGSCGSQDVWVSSTINPVYIQYTWPSNTTIQAIVIHHGQNNTRFLSGGTIQIWNGSAFVNHATFSNLPLACISQVDFTPVSTSRLKIIEFKVSGSQANNPNFREIEVLGSCLPGTVNPAKVWTGESTETPTTYRNDWNRADNWCPPGVPTGSDNVYIPKKTVQPVLYGSGTTPFSDPSNIHPFTGTWPQAFAKTITIYSDDGAELTWNGTTTILNVQGAF